MTEIIWYGRGGQGAFTAAKLLGAAYALKGDSCYSIAFPSFGPERRGAPVRAFTKLDSKPILDRSETEKVDYIVILDETLYSDSLKNLLKPDGRIIVNTKHEINDEVYSFDGSSISNSLHLPTVNTVMLGAVSEISGIVTIENLNHAIESYMPERIQDKNKKAMDAVKEEFR